MTDIVSQLLGRRGIGDAAAADLFLHPDYDRDTHDPYLMMDMDKAVERIMRAIAVQERICIYADYDADGIPGAALWSDFFSRIGYANYFVYIPHRHNEGFGLHVRALEEIASGVTDAPTSAPTHVSVSAPVKLLITVDCGISDVAAVARARELGMDVVITDHHQPPAVLPDALAIVDPKREGCPYPYKELCGTGVAWKVISAILAKNRYGLKEGSEKWMLDLVGIATLSDMVPLTGENRVLAKYGLTVLRKTPRPGLCALFARLRVSQKHLVEDDITFMITPRINAASRMGVPMDAYLLLSTRDQGVAATAAEHLDTINNERKGVVASLVKEIKKTLRERHSTAPIPRVIVMGNPEWRPSLLGLVANSCAEEFSRPVFLWGRDGMNEIKGSCRSDGRSDIVEIMRAVPAGVFTHCGGHRYAGGFAVSGESVHHLERHLNEAADVLASAAPAPAPVSAPAPDPRYDLELSLGSVTDGLYRDIETLAPFGLGNPKPIFLFRSVRPSTVRRFGKGNEHIELTFTHPSVAGATTTAKVSAIGFFAAESEWAALVREGTALDLLASVEKSVFRGKPELRLRIADVVMAR